MEFRPKSTIEMRSSRNKKSYRCFNNFKCENITKNSNILTNKLTYSSQEKKLYSLSDINEKITNSKGPNLRKQHIRLTDNELNKFFGNNKLIGWNHDKLFIRNYFKMLKVPQSAFNSKNKKIEYTKNKDNKSESSKNNEQLNSNNQNIDSTKKNERKRQNLQKEIKLQRIIPATKRNDIWMPKNFKNYDLLVKNPLLIETKITQESLLKRIPSYSYQEIRKKMNSTDIFFAKDKKAEKNTNRRVKSSYIFGESDIFCRKNDKVNLSKSGEKYLFNTNLLNKYTSSNESNSRWQPGINYPNLINHPSKNFNILSPNIRNNQYNKTKQTIFEECKNINKNKNDEAYQKKLLFFNPTHKQKGIGEFIDITKNGSSNPGKDFISKYKENPQCCLRSSEVCANFGDVYYNYKNVSARPFTKDRFES